MIKEWRSSDGLPLTLPRCPWPELLQQGPTGPTPSASGFHAGHRRTWACAPASRVKPCQVIFRCETYRGHWSWRRIPGGGAFPLWVAKRLVEEDRTQYCKKWRFPWKAGTHDLETELGKKYRLTIVSLMSWKYRFKIPFHILNVWEQITTFFSLFFSFGSMPTQINSLIILVCKRVFGTNILQVFNLFTEDFDGKLEQQLMRK